MPGPRSQRRADPDYALGRIAREVPANVALAIEEIVRAVGAMGTCGYHDPNKTRAIALGVEMGGGGEHQYFAVTTPLRHARNPEIGLRGFNVHVAFRGEAGKVPPGPRWFKNANNAGPDTQWWHLRPVDLGTDERAEILSVAQRSRESFA